LEELQEPSLPPVLPLQAPSLLVQHYCRPVELALPPPLQVQQPVLPEAPAPYSS